MYYLFVHVHYSCQSFTCGPEGPTLDRSVSRWVYLLLLMVQKSGKLTSWGWLFIPFFYWVYYTSQVRRRISPNSMMMSHVVSSWWVLILLFPLICSLILYSHWLYDIYSDDDRFGRDGTSTGSHAQTKEKHETQIYLRNLWSFHYIPHTFFDGWFAFHTASTWSPGHRVIGPGPSFFPIRHPRGQK